MRRQWFNKNLFFAIFFFFIFVGVVVINQLEIFGDVDTMDVLLAKENIPVDAEITKDMLYFLPMPRQYYQKFMIQDVNQIVGKQAVQEIKANSFITADMMDNSVLYPTPEHQFFPIPSNWILELQGTIRRYDLVDVIAIPDKSLAGQSVHGDVIPSATFLPRLEMIEEPVLEQIPVVFVKNTKNIEVLGKEGADDRLNGTSTPSYIELSLTLEEFKELEELFLKGYKFVFSYKNGGEIR